MAPGIMFLAGTQPASPHADAGSTAPGNGSANRPLTEHREQPNSVSPPQTRTADAAARSNKEPPRSDSPGYFTLSDSDGASNPGTESPQEDEVKAGGFRPPEEKRLQQHQKQPQQRHQVYKMFKSPSRPLSTSAASSPRTGKLILAARPNSDREKSKTPPRPSPPKGYSRRDSCGSDRGMTPPRPPPPLSYTSTLPPPVPKKTRPKTPTKTPTSVAKTPHQQQQHFKTIPAVRRSSSSASSANRKSSPAASTATPSSTLPRVQPLQMQSPSMIKALTKSVSARSESSPPLPPKERRSPPKEKTPPTPKKPKTFVQAFQSAHHGNNNDNSSKNNRASPSRGKGPSITPRQTKTSTVRASSSSSRTSPSPQPPKSPSEPGPSSRRSSVASTKASAEALKKAVMKTLQVNGRQESKKDKKGAAAAAAVGGDNLLSARDSKSSLEKIGSEPPKSKSPSPRRSSKSLSATAIEKIRERRNRSKDRAKKGDDREQRKNSSILPKKINSLIKHYEHGAGESQSGEGVLASNRSSGLSASQLSRLSQLSADELHSWLSSPMSSANLDKSMTEIDVLDQCVSEMMSFTTDALTTDTDSDTLKSGMFLNMLEHQRTSTDDDDVRKSVQEIIDKIERIESKPPVKPERTRKREKVTAAPSDDDLSHGVFTEVSFAGSFSSGISVAAPEAPKEAAKGKVELPPPLPSKKGPGAGGDDTLAKAPVPSPRTKRRARKEQMLLEHKEKGREALSILKSQSASCVPNNGARSPSPLRGKASASHQDGLECLELEELCSMSRGIERESGIIVRSRPPRQAESPTDEEDDDCDDKDAKICGADDEGKVCRGFLFTQREGEVPFFLLSCLPFFGRPFCGDQSFDAPPTCYGRRTD